jgi:hypothetical protein
MRRIAEQQGHLALRSAGSELRSLKRRERRNTGWIVKGLGSMHMLTSVFATTKVDMVLGFGVHAGSTPRPCAAWQSSTHRRLVWRGAVMHSRSCARGMSSSVFSSHPATLTIPLAACAAPACTDRRTFPLPVVFCRGSSTVTTVGAVARIRRSCSAVACPRRTPAVSRVKGVTEKSHNASPITISPAARRPQVL